MLRALRRHHAGRLAWVVELDGSHVLVRLDGLAAPGRKKLTTLSQAEAG